MDNYIRRYGNPDDEPISVTRSTSASRSPCGRSRSRSRSHSPRHDPTGVLNLDTKSTKAPTVTDDDEVTAFEKLSPTAKESVEFKSRLEEAFHSSIQREPAGHGSGPSRKRKRFSPAEDVESHPEHVEPEANGYVNGLEVHLHHPHSKRSRKAIHEDEPPVEYYAADKDKPLSLVPKSPIEQLDLSKSNLPIPKYSGLEPSSIPFPLHLTHRPPPEMSNLYFRPDILPFLLPPYHSASSESSAIPMFLHQFSYPQHLLSSMAEDRYRAEPPKDVRPSSPARGSPPKEASFYPPRVELSHPNQSSAVEPTH